MSGLDNYVSKKGRMGSTVHGATEKVVIGISKGFRALQMEEDSLGHKATPQLLEMKLGKKSPAL